MKILMKAESRNLLLFSFLSALCVSKHEHSLLSSFLPSCVLVNSTMIFVYISLLPEIIHARNETALHYVHSRTHYSHHAKPHTTLV